MSIVCRELRREPIWVAAIRVAYTAGRVDVDRVAAEANLVAGRERTVEDVLSTMAERNLLAPASGSTDGYVAGPVLRRSAPPPSAVANLAADGAHRWGRADD